MLSNCAAVSKLVSHPGNTPPSSYRAALSDASHQFRLVSVTSVDFTSVVFIETLVLADSGVGNRIAVVGRLSRSPPPSPGSSTVGLSAVGSSAPSQEPLPSIPFISGPGTLYGYAQGPHDAVLPRLPSGLGGDASRAGSSTFFPPGCHDTAPEVDCVDYLAYVDAKYMVGQSSPPLVFGYPIATPSAVWTCPVINPIAGLRCAYHVDLRFTVEHCYLTRSHRSVERNIRHAISLAISCHLTEHLRELGLKIGREGPAFLDYTFHTSQLHVSDSVMANLMCYVDRDQAGAEKSSSVSPCIDPVSSAVWVCKAVGASPDTICGHEIDLRQIANEYMSLGHERLIESALRVAFRAAINGHLLAHLHKIGLEFNRDGLHPLCSIPSDSSVALFPCSSGP
ncbi:hypothetical protein DFH06DRAFT_1350728 [Mycena polygramma]|nr:hypothetical protein DFH06DRAFT_1350728 [Mycena polygramma]